MVDQRGLSSIKSTVIWQSIRLVNIDYQVRTPHPNLMTDIANDVQYNGLRVSLHFVPISLSYERTKLNQVGLSHTRTDPPTLEELQSDSARQTRLRPMIQAIEAREEAERIRQGYLPAPGTSSGGSGGLVEGYAHASMPRSISGPGPSRINTKPSFAPNTDSRSRPQPQSQRTSPTPTSSTGSTGSRPAETGGSGGSGQEYPVPTPTSQTVPPPPPTVDPLQHDDPAELRRLAEEDTKRRIEERGGEADLREGGGSGKVEGVDVGPGGGGLAPRRRGKK